MRWKGRQLARGAVARPEVTNYPQSGDAVHEALREADGLSLTVHHLEQDSVLEVSRRGPTPAVSVARWSVCGEPPAATSATTTRFDGHAHRRACHPGQHGGSPADALAQQGPPP